MIHQKRMYSIITIAYIVGDLNGVIIPEEQKTFSDAVSHCTDLLSADMFVIDSLPSHIYFVSLLSNTAQL